MIRCVGALSCVLFLLRAKAAQQDDADCAANADCAASNDSDSEGLYSFVQLEKSRDLLQRKATDYRQAESQANDAADQLSTEDSSTGPREIAGRLLEALRGDKPKTIPQDFPFDWQWTADTTTAEPPTVEEGGCSGTGCSETRSQLLSEVRSQLLSDIARLEIDEGAPALSLERLPLLKQTKETKSQLLSEVRNQLLSEIARLDIDPTLPLESKCSPDPSDFSQLDEMMAQERHATMASDTVELPSFYLHESHALGFLDVRDCFLKEFKLDIHYDNMDSNLEIVAAEHLGELWLMELLATHPKRTYNESAAKLHVIGALPYLSYNASLLENGDCGTPNDHHRRMHELEKAMRRIQARRQGAKLFLATTHFVLDEVFGNQLLQFMSNTGVIAGTADVDFGGEFNEGWGEYKSITKVVIPYKAHRFGENHNAWEVQDANRGKTRNRDFYFRGCLHRSQNNEGALRATVIPDLAIRLNESRNADVLERCVVGKSAGGRWLKSGGDAELVNDLMSSLEARTKLAETTAREYTDSRFCFVPAGDSPTSRRLFDVLAAGCVPIYMGDTESMLRNLPFPRTIDWRKIMLFAGDLQCTSDNMDDITFSLFGVSSDSKYELWKQMSRLGMMAFHNSLNYKRNGLADALLRELQPLLW